MNSKYARHDDYRKKPGFNFVFPWTRGLFFEL